MEINKVYKVVLKDGRSYVGRVMPKTKYNKEDSIILKLESGYNVAFRMSDVKEYHTVKVPSKPTSYTSTKAVKGKHNILFLSTGGTILSRVEYETGGVVATFSPQEIIEQLPWWYDADCNFYVYEIMNEMSENLTPKDWEHISKKVLEYYKKHKDVEGIVIAHGTDTLHYTSAALSFALLCKVEVPIVLVGSQRSADRPSSDGVLNFIASLEFIKSSPKKGVFVCMHADVGDEVYNVHLGTRVRKMHTSRRDAFKSINASPYAKVNFDLSKKAWSVEVKGLREDFDAKDVKIRFSDKCALIKYYPGMDVSDLEYFLESKEGIILEGTGLGHINVSNEKILEVIRTYSSDKFIGMASQTLYGRVHESVYKNLRLLSDAGVVYLKNMLPEVSYVKLSLALGNFSSLEEIKEFMLTPIFYEIGDAESL